MNTKIVKMLEQAGFGLWADEDWNPGDVVDWSARYDDELREFVRLMIEECAQVCVRTGTMEMSAEEGSMYANAIREHFKS